MDKRDLIALVTGLSMLGVVVGVGAQTAPKPAQTDPKAVPPKAAATDPKPTAPSTKPAQQIEGSKRFAERTGLNRASKVIGMAVKDPAGKDAGNIEDLLLDAKGDIAYGVFSFGGFLGVGDKLFAVPWDSMVVDRDNNVVVLDVSKETLERAPSWAKDKWPNAYDRNWQGDVRKAWSDASITAAVKSKLGGDKGSSLVKVNVDTNQGVVELSGNVDSERTKQRASELARQVEGVRKVVNNLKTTG